jgi:microcin C transport system permease protein
MNTVSADALPPQQPPPRPAPHPSPQQPGRDELRPGERSAISLSPNQRAWARFRRNRLGYGALMVFAVLLVLSTCAELLSNERPLVARYQGEWFFRSSPTIRRSVSAATS